jgi:small-conductance mechanosensitive channel
MISDNGLSMTVTAGVLKFNVAKAFLTNDLDVGVLLASQNSTELARANAQNAAQRKLLDQKAQVDAVQQSQAIIDAAKRSVDAANRAASGSGSRLQTSGDLMDGAYDQQSSIVEHSYTDAQGHVHTWHRTASGTTIGN